MQVRNPDSGAIRVLSGEIRVDGRQWRRDADACELKGVVGPGRMQHRAVIRLAPEDLDIGPVWIHEYLFRMIYAKPTGGCVVKPDGTRRQR